MAIRKSWTRNETILVLELYCRTPFSKISKSNKDIIMLAQLLDRTPSSVGLKMANLASIDPTIRQKGMSNYSSQDKTIFDEFFENLDYLSEEAKIIYDQIIEESTQINDKLELKEGIDVRRYTVTREGQDLFRKSILIAYGNRCCITGINEPQFLVASHIKPWSKSEPKTERTNPKNGLCLNPMHDKAFDRGFITIDSDYRLVISKRINDIEMDKSTSTWFRKYEGEQIHLPDKWLPSKIFIEYHNNNIFLG